MKTALQNEATRRGPLAQQPLTSSSPSRACLAWQQTSRKALLLSLSEDRLRILHHEHKGQSLQCPRDNKPCCPSSIGRGRRSVRVRGLDYVVLSSAGSTFNGRLETSTRMCKVYLQHGSSFKVLELVTLRSRAQSID